MPSSRHWRELLRETFRDVGGQDIAGLFSREWSLAKEKLTSEDPDPGKVRRPGLRRVFTVSNSVLFGLARRLAPARRVAFLAVLLCLAVATLAPRNARIDLDGLVVVATVLLGLLLAMELVDKINYRDELELARDLQASLIPKQLPDAGGYALGAHNEIANTVGGDIYDFVPLSGGRLAILFGDASGHGMAAGLVMAVAHAAFRTQLDVDPSPGEMFATLNRILCRTGGPRAFFGCVYLLLDADGAFSGAVAGHPPALIAGADGRVRERLGTGAYPLGIRPDAFGTPVGGRLAPGETLFFHSDGLPEARDAEGREFGDDRIEAAIRRGIAAGLSAPALAEAIAAELAGFRGRQATEDDVSIAVVRRSG